MDFTINTYKSLLLSILNSQKKFVSFRLFQDISFKIKAENYLILRHDVDELPNYALKMATIEKSFGIKSSYYFRAVPESYDLEIIHQVANLGHEIGYHYEDVDLVIKSKKLKGKSKKLKEEELIDWAYDSFCRNLERFRKDFDIKTICMHGSPLSPYDNRMIWKKYDYRDLGIIGEPYFDIDFNKVFYLTDTGRRWDGDRVVVRDKIEKKGTKIPTYKTTFDIIKAVEDGSFPKQAMITFHPQRWHNSFIPWAKELAWQNVKNLVKFILIKCKYHIR